MKITIYFLVVLLLLISCEKSRPLLVYEENKTFHCTDYCINFINSDSLSCFYYTDINDSSITVINSKTNEIIKTINSSEIIKTIGINSFRSYEIHINRSLDRVLATNSSKSIFLFSHFGKFKNKWKFKKDVIIPKQFDFDISWSIELYNDSLIMSTIVRIINIGSKTGRQAYHGFPKLGKIYLKNDTAILENEIGYAPKRYREGLDYNNSRLDFCINKSNEVVCNYRASHYLYIYNENNKLKKVKARSKFINKDDVFKDYKGRPGDRYEIDRYDVENFFYEDIVYDRYRDIYYRLVSLPTKFENPDGSINKHTDFSIMIIDSNFKILNEIKFSNKEFTAHQIVPYKDGLIIKQWPTENEKFKKISLCKFVYQD